jgi:hypothetical protein
MIHNYSEITMNSQKALDLANKRDLLLKQLKEIEDEMKEQNSMYLEEEYCKDIQRFPISGDELFEAIKPMGSKSPWEYSDAELDRVIRVLRGATAIHMKGSSKEAQSAVAQFYGDFAMMVAEKPSLAELF